MTATPTDATISPSRDHEPDVEVLATALGVDLHRGLTQTDAEDRLARDGTNEIRATAPVPRWRKVIEQFRDPLVYLLAGAVVVSVLAWFVEGRTGVPVDAIVISLVLVANAVLGYTQEARADGAVAALTDLVEPMVTVLRDGEEMSMPASSLVRGDVLCLSEGDSVGADARLCRASSLRVAESSLTGESEAVGKAPGDQPTGLQLGDRSAEVFKGTAVIQGTGRALVTATAMSTQVGRIAGLLDSTVQAPTPLEVEVARVGKVLGAAVIVVAVVTMTTIWLISDVRTLPDAVTVLLLGVSLAVAAVPEGLPAVLSVVLSNEVQRMARREAIVKRLSSVETLGSTTVICSDKTGTLTRNEMTVQVVMTASGSAELSGVGYAPHGELTDDRGSALEGAHLEEVTALLTGAALSSDATLREVDGQWQILGDPTEAAFLVAERKADLTSRRTARFTRLAAVPFTSRRKMMSTLQDDHHDESRVLVTKGAPDVVLALCDRVQVGDRVHPLTADHRDHISGEIEQMSGQALRTLSVAYRSVAVDEG